MGTVEKIVDTLNKMCMDKKSQATHRYEEHSAWLSTEFKNLRILIQVQNPGPPERDSSESRQKRKSPETSSNGIRNSPQAKRSSSDFADIAIGEGLPADLNRLKKEELLAALESRGNCTMTMKALKKDMVDALKDLLLDISGRGNGDAPQPQHADDKDSQSPVTSAKESSHTEKVDSVQDSIPTVELSHISNGGMAVDSPQVRKVSILAEARQQVIGARQSVLQEKQESSADRMDRLAHEYEARKMRHRSSQVRLSQAVHTNDENRSRSSSIASTGCPADNSARQELPRDMPEETSTPVDEPMDGAREEDEDGTWNEVPSPHREDSADMPADSKPEPPAQSSSVQNLTAGYESKSLFSNAPVGGKIFHRDHAKTLPLPGSATPVTSNSAAVDSTATGDAVKPIPPQKSHSSDSIPDDRKTGQTATGSATVGSGGEVSHMKKISNLIGGTQTSFLGGSSSTTSFLGGNKDKIEQTKPKAVVPALQQAMKLKEKEEARAAQKKKELEEKKKEYMRKMQQSSNSSMQGTASGKLFPSKLASSKPTAPSTVSQPTQKKGGFGWFGKKEASGAPAAAAGPADSTKSQPLTAAQLALKTSSKKQAVEQPASAPYVEEAMVDQENAKPVRSDPPSAPTTVPSAPVASHKVLGEKKIDPSEYRQTAPAPSTPAAVTKGNEEYEPSPPRDEYQIRDIDDSDEENDSGTDDDEADKQQIPDWARGIKLREALERQYGLNGHTAADPDLIFTDVQTCSLEEIFDRREGKCGKYSVRTSSAKWDADEITLVEKRNYRAQMGFEGIGL